VTNGENNGREPDLRPLIARLKEIERKCESMGSRNEEFPLMRDKLAAIVAQLEASVEPSGEPISYHSLARELFPIAHLFESVGFTSVGREIAHVERALKELEPEPAMPNRPIAPAAAASVPSDEEASTIKDLPDEDEPLQEDARDGVPTPVLAGFFILIVAIAMAAAVIFEIGPFEPEPAATPVPVPSRVVTRPTAEPPPPTRAPRDPNATPSARQRFLDALSQARLALRSGDVDEALKHLSIAALIDRHDTSVIEVADQIVDATLQNAAAAAGEGRWDDAAQFTGEARTVATRFGRDTRRIDATEQSIAEMERYRIVEPVEIEVLRASIGKLVEVQLAEGSMVVGRIAGVDGPDLVLEVEDDVGGGIVSFTDSISLSDISWIRIWED
jgi:hypothetical protein